VVQGLIESVTGYPGLWLVCTSSGVVLPLPEDVPLMYAGTRIAEGLWTWPLTLVIAWVGVGARDVLSWAFGRYVVRRLIEAGRLGWLVSGRRATRARDLVGDHGSKAVLLGRFLVGFRVPVFVAAGATGVPLRSFVLVDGVGLMLAVPMAVGLGFWFGVPVAELTAAVLQRLSSGSLVVGAVAALMWLTWRATKVTRKAVAIRRGGLLEVEVDEDDSADLG
jgi:membrane protein DedA with SNARE-associated domain